MRLFFSPSRRLHGRSRPSLFSTENSQLNPQTRRARARLTRKFTVFFHPHERIHTLTRGRELRESRFAACDTKGENEWSALLMAAFSRGSWTLRINQNRCRSFPPLPPPRLSPDKIATRLTGSCSFETALRNLIDGFSQNVGRIVTRTKSFFFFTARSIDSSSRMRDRLPSARFDLR